MTTMTIPAPRKRIEPLTVAELGVSPGIVRDLAAKAFFYRGRLTRSELADELRVSSPAAEEIIRSLDREGAVRVLVAETTDRTYSYTLTQRGIEIAEEALGRNGYSGPVPVSLAAYVARVKQQSIEHVEIDPEDIDRAMSRLVLDEQTSRRVAWAVASRKPMLVYGASGNGKTTLVRHIGDVIGGTVNIPYAIEFGGQIIRVFDASKHLPVADGIDAVNGVMRHKSDRRWVEIERPLIWAGGELTAHSLELAWDADARLYEAPLQMKANGGILIIDDLGRQQIPAVSLLNRWIVALESGADHLTLHTGQTLEIPFDVLLMFSTNLTPESLADEAFLRRIRYKIEIPSPDESQYREIIRQECEKRGVAFDEEAASHLISRWYCDGRELRGCHPRDIVEAVVDAAGHDRREPALTVDAIDEACASYFLPVR